MKISILSDRENPLLARREIWAILKVDKTPTREEVRARFAAEFGANENLVVVDKILPMAGTPDVKVYVKIYKDENLMKRLELPKKYQAGGGEGGEEGAQQEVAEVQG